MAKEEMKPYINDIAVNIHFKLYFLLYNVLLENTVIICKSNLS